MFSCLPGCSSAVGSRALRARRARKRRRRGGRAREGGGSGKNQSPVSATSSSFSARRCRSVQGHFLHVTPPPLPLFLFENRTMARVSVFLPAHDAPAAASFFPRWRGSGNAYAPRHVVLSPLVRRVRGNKTPLYVCTERKIAQKLKRCDYVIDERYLNDVMKRKLNLIVSLNYITRFG